jgi:NADP-dependent 3-hydroxy acid dehydrogenase YdfG/acyl carrier protein/ubiquinone/menaquinone biosynthesis C-methylase UbiE
LAALDRFVARSVGSDVIERDAAQRPPLLTLRPVWVPLGEPVAAAPQGPILILTTADGLKLTHALEAAATVAVVRTIVLDADWSAMDDAALKIAGTMPAAIFFIAVHDRMPSGAEARAVQAEDITRALFRLIKALGRHSTPPRLTVITGRTQRVFPGEPAGFVAAGLIGLAKAAAHENPGWAVRLLDLDPGEPLAADIVLGILPHAADLELAVRGGRVYGRRLERLLLPERATTPWTPGGRYLIVGGAGGIGVALARHLGEAAAARIALLGRSALDGAKERDLAVIAAAGGEAIYVRADLADLEALREAVREVRARFGHIDGVVHSAMVMHDATIARLEEDELSAVLAPKLRGLVNLVEVLSDDPPDWLHVMSSANAYTANPGQSAYAAASSFADAFALAVDDMPVRVLDWGLWGETGRVATAEYRTALSRVGVYPIATSEGLDLIGRALTLPLPQLFALRVADQVAQSMGVLPARATRLAETRGPSVRAHAEAAGVAATAARIGALAGTGEFERVNAYGRARLLLTLSPSTTGETPTPDRLIEELGVVPRYRRLAAALADMLGRVGASADAATLDNERALLLTTAPDAAPYLALLDHCIAALPEVLSGKTDANTVLFPSGSAALVEAIYRGNKVVDAYQRILSDAVRAAVLRRLADRAAAGETVRIVEVGAGTGGTTGFVLAALGDLGEQVEYVVTDIGRGFVEQARQRFGPTCAIARFATLDIAADPAEQGFAAGSFDIAIAANVVHATRDIAQTLANVKILLARGGLLFLNEAVAAQDFNTLTFGLTAGWWLFEDAERRLPHAPLLDLAGWKRSLGEAGFLGCTAFGAAPPGVLQAIVMAESDGLLSAAAAAPTASPVAVATTGPPAPPPVARGDTLPHIESVLRDTVAAALHLEPDEVEAEVSFSEYGADSIISVDLVRQINEAFNIELKTTALFNYATIRELAGFIAVEFGDRIGGNGDKAIALGGDVAARVSEAKDRSNRLREVIRKRLDRPAMNREREFLARETRAANAASNGSGQTDADPVGDRLGAILAALERGEIGVEAALRMKISDG